MLWVNEGFVLDDAGNMLTTSYIDLRHEGERTVIRSLVKGCKREHALKDGETMLISKPERFREYGVALIRDEQEREYRFVVLNGGAAEETVLLKISGMMRDALAPSRARGRANAASPGNFPESRGTSRIRRTRIARAARSHPHSVGRFPTPWRSTLPEPTSWSPRGPARASRSPSKS